jgi:oxaloacetate decarboxylase alpha subunit
MATATYVEAVRAGAGAIDCAISAMAGFSSQPPVETMLAIFDETSYHASLDIEALRKICDYFQGIAPERRPSHHPDNIIDPEILVHHIPGGMISNLRSQLQQQNALDRLDEVLNELPRVRADLGYPPLVTPTSQIVGVQAVMNILAGERYALVPQETKNYVKGLYGRSPAPINYQIRRKILGKEKPVTCRPADLMEPMLPKATDGIESGMIKSEEDIISYCLFPEPALEYFRWRNLPPEKRPPSPADEDREKEKTAKAQQTLPPLRAFLSAQDYKELNALVEKVSDLHLSELTIRRDDLSLSMKTSGITAARDAADQAPKDTKESSSTTMQKEAAEPPPKPAAPAEPSEPKETHAGPTIDAPLNGTFYATGGPGKPVLVKEGDTVKAGEPVCIVEAMKLFNQIKAAFDCKIVRLLVKHGDKVQKDQALFAVEKL